MHFSYKLGKITGLEWIKIIGTQVQQSYNDMNKIEATLTTKTFKNSYLSLVSTKNG